MLEEQVCLYARPKNQQLESYDQEGRGQVSENGAKCLLREPTRSQAQLSTKARMFFPVHLLFKSQPLHSFHSLPPPVVTKILDSTAAAEMAHGAAAFLEVISISVTSQTIPLIF